MRYALDQFESGWIGVSLALRPGEVDSLISLLESLRDGVNGHFHLAATDYSGNKGIADVEFSLQSETEADNMTIG